MGVHTNINPPAGKFPKQSDNVNRRVEVCFHYDTTRTVLGTIVRDDMEAPGEMLIAIDDGPVVRSVECMYSFANAARAATTREG